MQLRAGELSCPRHCLLVTMPKVHGLDPMRMAERALHAVTKQVHHLLATGSCTELQRG